tara:strand:- start:60 stop:467 length:408 start_codon:yes stop_codon:yes gene_type:complete
MKLIKLKQCYYLDKLSIQKNIKSKKNLILNFINKYSDNVLIFSKNIGFLRSLLKFKNFDNESILVTKKTNVKLFKKYKFILISSFDHVRGINLPYVNNIIFCHKISKETYNDIISLCINFGEKKNINVYNIHYPN